MLFMTKAAFQSLCLNTIPLGTQSGQYHGDPLFWHEQKLPYLKHICHAVIRDRGIVWWLLGGLHAWFKFHIATTPKLSTLSLECVRISEQEEKRAHENHKLSVL